jgi:peptidylprolyl isomerase
MQTGSNKWPAAALMLLSLLPTAALAATPPPEASWLDIPQQQLVYLQVSDGKKDIGQVVLQLADPFTPKTSARFRQLVQDRFYDGLPFYRVIDQFVLQAGLPETENHPAKLNKSYPALPAEFSWPIRSSDPYTAVQSGDLLADETGFNQGFAVGRAKGREWLIHCPNLVNMARDSNPVSATTDFAIMQGQAPRHLDRNMNVFARVIWGTEVLNFVPRGDKAAGGILDTKARRGLIISARLGSDIPKTSQLPLQQQLTHSDDFQQMLKRRRARSDEFYQDKGNGKLDICYLGAPVRLKTAQ